LNVEKLKEKTRHPAVAEKDLRRQKTRVPRLLCGWVIICLAVLTEHGWWNTRQTERQTQGPGS